MAVIVYKSTDAGAPSLSNVAGSLIALLDACLVTGYGTQPAAGWTKPFVGTNLAAYKQPAVGSNGLYLRVDDTVANTARIVGYEAMTAVSAGTNAFPTEAQLSAGCWVYKSNGGARAWVLASNGASFWLWVDILGEVLNSQIYGFVDCVSYRTGDAFATLIMANSGSATPNDGGKLATSIVGAAVGHYLARSHTQLGGSVTAGKSADAAKSNGAVTIGSGGAAYPSPIDGGFYISPVFANETAGLRGVAPGLWSPCHAKPLGHLDTFAGSGELAGKTFLAINIWSAGQLLLETSNTW